MSLGQLAGQKGYFQLPIDVTLPATLNSQLATSVQVLQGADFKVVCVNTTQTGNWSVIWGTFTINFSSGNINNTDGFVRYQNAFGTAILPHRYVGPQYDYCPIFPRGSVIKFTFRNDTALSNVVQVVLEGIYDQWLNP
jgi:hypothetical protein